MSETNFFCITPNPREAAEYPEYAPGGEYGPDEFGWYFWDETGAYFHGPFNTIETCKAALQYYCEVVLATKP